MVIGSLSPAPQLLLFFDADLRAWVHTHDLCFFYYSFLFFILSVKGGENTQSFEQLANCKERTVCCRLE